MDRDSAALSGKYRTWSLGIRTGDLQEVADHWLEGNAIGDII
jgi:hypothetical protein